MTKKVKVTLSRVPSVAITEALADLVKCERSPKYNVDMGHWYAPNAHIGGVCEVCLAGAVMAKRLGNGPYPRSPGDYRGNIGVLNSLDFFRTGEVGRGFKSLNLSTIKGLVFDREIVLYGRNPGQFKREMRQLARDLEAAGY